MGRIFLQTVFRILFGSAVFLGGPELLLHFYACDHPEILQNHYKYSNKTNVYTFVPIEVREKFRAIQQIQGQRQVIETQEHVITEMTEHAHGCLSALPAKVEPSVGRRKRRGGQGGILNSSNNLGGSSGGGLSSSSSSSLNWDGSRSLSDRAALVQSRVRLVEETGGLVILPLLILFNVLAEVLILQAIYLYRGRSWFGSMKDAWLERQTAIYFVSFKATPLNAFWAASDLFSEFL